MGAHTHTHTEKHTQIQKHTHTHTYTHTHTHTHTASGRQRHLAAELEVHTLEEVAISSREDALGLKLLNLRTSALALRQPGLVREVYGLEFRV